MSRPVHLTVNGLSVQTRQKALLSNVTLDLYKNEVLCLIGSADSGKSLLLRALSRMLDDERGVWVDGSVVFDGQDIYAPDCDVPGLRRRIAYLSDQTSLFPTSIWENLAYGIKLNRLSRNRREIGDRIEAVLRRLDLWEDLKDQLHNANVADLPPVQKRRLCLARCIAVEPDILLLDRPAGTAHRIDPAALIRITEELKRDFSMMVVTHSLTEAAAVSDRVAFLEQGELVEVDQTELVFTSPLNPRTQQFVDSMPH